MKKFLFHFLLLPFSISALCQTAEQYYERALVEGRNENYKGSLEDLNKAIALNDKDDNLYYVRGTLKNKLLQFEGAILDLAKAVELNPNNGTAYQNRGIVKMKLQDYKGVIEDCSKAIKVDTSLFEAYIQRGNAKGLLEDYKGAISDFTQVIMIAPEFPLRHTAFLMRGAAKLMLGEKISGCLDLKQAQKLGDATAAKMIKDNCN